MPRARCLPSPRCCSPRIRGRSSSPLLFFFYLTLFATALTFVFCSFFLSFSHQARVLWSKQSLSTDFKPTRRPPLSRNILVLLLEATEQPDAHRRHSSEVPLRLTEIPAVVSSKLYDSKNIAEERAVIALVAAMFHHLPWLSVSDLESPSSRPRGPPSPASFSGLRRTPNLAGVAADYRRCVPLVLCCLPCSSSSLL